MNATALDDPAHGQAVTTIQPLRRVTHIDVSERSGTDLNPHYFWLTWEYHLRLDCGHTATRARCAYDRNPAPAKLKPPLPTRVRCTDCAPVATRPRRARRSASPPTYDPVAAALVAQVCKADPDHQDEMLAWVAQHGRYATDPATRARGYTAMALLLIDLYLTDTDNPHAAEVRAVVAAYGQGPTEETRVAVRRACQRLYGSQSRRGEWFANRGVILAGRMTAPYPHNVRAALEAPTWDFVTRSERYSQLWNLRTEYDEQRLAEWETFLEDDGDGVRHHNDEAQLLAEQLDQAASHGQPTIGPRHRGVVLAMLRAYQDAVGQR